MRALLRAFPTYTRRRVFQQDAVSGELLADRIGAGEIAGLLGGVALVDQCLDPRVVAAVAGMLIAVALVACVLPARRAARTDPLIALSDQ